VRKKTRVTLAGYFALTIWRIRCARSLLCLSCAVICALAQFLLIVKYTEQAAGAKFNVAKTLLQVQENFEAPEPAALRAKRDQFILECEHRRWWNLKFIDNDLIQYWKTRNANSKWRNDLQTVLRSRLAAGPPDKTE
jgi:hypothetical protein